LTDTKVRDRGAGRAPLSEIDRCRYKVSVEPLRPKAWRRLAEALEPEAPEEAVLSWRRLLELDAGDVEAQTRLGRLLCALGRPGDAVEHLRAAADARPSEVKRWKALAQALEGAGQPQAAAIAQRKGQVMAAEGDARAHLLSLGFPPEQLQLGQADEDDVSRLDLSRPFPLARKWRCLRRVRSASALATAQDAYLTLDVGGEPIVSDPVISVEPSGADRIGIDVVTARTFVAALDAAALVGRGTIVTRGGTVVADFLKRDLSKHHAARCGDAFMFDATHFLGGECPVQRFDTPAALMVAPTDLSFGDWINNFPPRLALFEAAGLDVPLVVNRRLPGKFIDMLVALGVRRERLLFHNPDGVSIFPRLYAPSWPLADRLKPMKGLYDIYQRMPREAPPAVRALIYLSRRGIGNRSMLNENEVCELFARRGFEIVMAEDLDLAETLRRFDNPLCVAGPYGSAIRNLVFCRQKPVSLMIMPPYSEHFVRGVALWFHGVGVPFAYVRGAPTDRGADVDANTASWTAPLDRIDAAIDIVLAEATRRSLTQ
jgi:hypothetical protein